MPNKNICDYADKGWLKVNKSEPLRNQDLAKGEGKGAPFNLESRIAKMIDLHALPEYFVKELILTGSAKAGDFKRYPKMLSDVREYLNSDEAVQDPGIPSANLAQMREDFELPGLIGEAEFCFSDLDHILKNTLDSEYPELLVKLEEALFQLEKKLDPKVKRLVFDKKIAENELLDLSALFENLKKELAEAEQKKKSRRNIKDIFRKIFSSSDQTILIRT